MKNLMKILFMATVLLAITLMGCTKPPLPPPPPPTTAPVVETVEASLLKADQNGATITVSGKIVSDGGAIIDKRGFCVSKTNPTPSVSDIVRNSNSFSPNYTETIKLEVNTRYYVRAYAQNKNGVSYGKAIIIRTDWLVKDYDGNVYHTVYVNKRWWLQEDLKVTHYNDGEPIPNVIDGNQWSYLNTGAYCNYNNDTSLVKTYSRIYNYYAVETGKLAIEGWHVPTEDEIISLYMALGNDPHNGGKLKETGTEHWKSPNAGATNSTGLTAIPGGWRSSGEYKGLFGGLHQDLIWWIKEKFDPTRGEVAGADYNSNIFYVLLTYPKANGNKVRLIRNK